MSTILKALRRLEEERESEARDLRDQVVARPRFEPRRPRLLVLAGAGAVGALLVVGGFWLVDDRPGEHAGAAAPRATRPVAPAPADRAEAPLPRSPEAGHTRVAATPGHASVTTPALTPPPAMPVSGVHGANTAEPSPLATEVDPPPQAARTAPLPSPQAARIASVPEPPPQVAPVTSLSPVAAGPDAAPLPREMPGIVGQPEVVRRMPLPRIVVERTLWHPTPGRRLAYLHVEGRAGGVELREGDAVGDAVVQQIDPSAVVFLHRGVEIRRRVGAGR